MSNRINETFIAETGRTDQTVWTINQEGNLVITQEDCKDDRYTEIARLLVLREDIDDLIRFLEDNKY